MRSIVVPHIWIPRVKTGEVIVEASPALRGDFTFELRDKESGKVRKRLEFHNLVLDKAFDALLTGKNVRQLCGYIYLGTGVTLPQPTDTTLANQIISKSGTITYGWGEGYGWVATQAFFDTNEANGDLSEVGVGSAALYARELIRDANGNPVVITKTNQETLTVTHTLRIEAPALGYSESMIGEYTCRTYYVNQVFQNWVMYATNSITIGGADPGAKLGNSNAPSSPTDGAASVKGSASTWISYNGWSAYTAGQLYRDYALLVAANQANFAEGIGEILWSSGTDTTARYYGRTTFAPQIPKTSAYTLQIQHRISFARAA